MTSYAKNIETLLGILNRKLNRPATAWRKRPERDGYDPCIGHLFAERWPMHGRYNGWRLAEMMEHGGERHPLGERIYSGIEFVALLNVILAMVDGALPAFPVGRETAST